MAEQRAIEGGYATSAILVAYRIHFAQHERMAADRALAEDDQVARKDVRTLDRDRDRNRLVAAAEIIVRPEHDALAPMDIHRVVAHTPSHLGDVVLEDRGRHRGLLSVVDRSGGHAARRIHDVA